MFTSMFPILATPDLQRSLHFYRDLLGATETYRFPDTGPPIFVWVYADDCDEAVRRLADAGVRVLAMPQDQPWGERVARVSDPDGTEVHIGSASADPSAKT